MVTLNSKSLWQWARWGLLAMTLLTGGALVLTLWSGYQSAQRIATQVTRAEGYTLLNSIRRRLKGKTPIKDADLQAALNDMKGTGLKYIGVFRLRGRQVAATGTPIGHTTFPVRRGLQSSQRVGARVRMTTVGFYRKRIHPWWTFRWNAMRWERRRFRQPRLHGPRLQGPHHQDRRTRRRRFRRRPVLLVIEFEPLSARLIQGEAQWTLMVGGVAALILLLMTSLFWVILRRLSTLEGQRQRQEQLAALGEMSAVMAHEIRNPLTSLKGHAQLLVEYLPEESKPRAKAERVVHEAIRLEQLSSQLLDFVRVGTLEWAETNPVALLQEISETLEPERFVWDTQQAPAAWMMDPTRLRQVLTNLMQNALQASPEGATVSIRVAEDRRHLKIWIRDYGKGVSPEDIDKIFSPFYTTRLHGTGLGLAVAQKWVELHGGTLSVSNPPGGGAEFVVSLPHKENLPDMEKAQGS